MIQGFECGPRPAFDPFASMKPPLPCATGNKRWRPTPRWTQKSPGASSLPRGRTGLRTGANRALASPGMGRASPRTHDSSKNGMGAWDCTAVSADPNTRPHAACAACPQALARLLQFRAPAGKVALASCRWPCPGQSRDGSATLPPCEGTRLPVGPGPVGLIRRERSRIRRKGPVCTDLMAVAFP